MEPDENVITSKGLAIRLRPIQPDDAGNLIALFEHMGVESRYNRFNQSLVDPDPALVQRTAIELATVAPATGEAWLAFAEIPGEGMVPVGGARYMRTEPEVAEVSVVVRDDFQRQGVGAALLERVFRDAKAAGIRTLTAGVRHDNAPIKALIKKIPWPVTWQHDGPYAMLVVDLDQLPPEGAMPD